MRIGDRTHPTVVRCAFRKVAVRTSLSVRWFTGAVNARLREHGATTPTRRPHDQQRPRFHPEYRTGLHRPGRLRRAPPAPDVDRDRRRHRALAPRGPTHPADPPTTRLRRRGRRSMAPDPAGAESG